MFETARLRALAPNGLDHILERTSADLERLAAKYRIDSDLRRAHFIAQVCHESAGFRRLTENLNYSAKRIGEIWPRLKPRAAQLAYKPEALANAAYADRTGNGDEASGDGWRFRGRGLIQLTGRANYLARGGSIGADLVKDPDRAAGNLATEIALDYWRSRNCNEAADRDDVERVTRLVNGGTHGLVDRRELTEKAKRIFIREEPLVS